MLHKNELPQLSNSSYSGWMSKLPPRSPLPSMSHASKDHESSLPTGKKHMLVSKESQKQHQRTSSESFIIDDQPAWLDDLLNESETPAGRGTHRRSSSDSVQYLDAPVMYAEIENFSQPQLCSSDISSFPLLVSCDFDQQRNATHASFLLEETDFVRSPVLGWDSSRNSCSYRTPFASARDNMLAYFGPSCIHRDRDCSTAEKQKPEKFNESDRQCSERRDSSFVKLVDSDVDQHDQKGCLERECSNGKPAESDADQKRAKQRFAQRSRVRKLQYIAELERIVHILNAEGSDAAAELVFLKKQHLILRLENKALMQRISTVAHEKQIKDAEYELLRKEVERLRDIYCNQQQERLKSQCNDAVLDAAADHLNLQFGCLSLTSANHMETGPVKEPGVMNKAAPYPCMMIQKS